MISYEQALRKILKHTSTLPMEIVRLEDSLGRVVRENVFSGIEMPPFNKSAVDGYALNFLDTKKVPVRLRCIGLIQAGDSFKKRVEKGECVKIMTGAALPQNTNSVVMVEDVKVSGEQVILSKTMARRENVCLRAEDIKRSQKVLTAGKKITASEIAILATVGKPSVRVPRKPSVAILNTGGEIAPVGTHLGKDKIYNSNGPMLEVLLLGDGIQPLNLGIIKDNAAALKKAVRRGLKTDVLLISGGVSMGDYDLIPGVLRSLSVRKIFHKVNIKPGKPLFFGIKGEKIIFGIPGNPVSNFLSYLIFVRPALYKMMGKPFCKPHFKEGFVNRKFRAKTGRRHFVPVKISHKQNSYYLMPLHSHGSADILALSKADGFMIVNEKSSIIEKNSKILFITWKII